MKLKSFIFMSDRNWTFYWTFRFELFKWDNSPPIFIITEKSFFDNIETNWTSMNSLINWFCICSSFINFFKVPLKIFWAKIKLFTYDLLIQLKREVQLILSFRCSFQFYNWYNHVTWIYFFIFDDKITVFFQYLNIWQRCSHLYVIQIIQVALVVFNFKFWIKCPIFLLCFYCSSW